MAFVLYEVWTEDENGRETFVSTQGSLRDANRMAEDCIKEDGAYQAFVIMDDDNADDVVEVSRMKNLDFE